MPRRFRKPRLQPRQSATPEVEYIEVVDEGNRPIAVMPIDDVHAQALMHRAVVVLVYDDDGRVYLQKRSMSKSRFPGRWDLSATGHVKAGEAMEDGAIRELHEELGLSATRMHLLAEVSASASTGWEFVSIFTAGTFREEPVPNPEEVDGGYFVDRAELDCLVAQFRELLTPALVHFWEHGLIFPSASPALPPADS
ncbi:NUDIX hydrolase [Desulfovibrio sp. X2]|uniref:NUDIX hydrolase n=1 Tax=Desulfovibrio sp. X2 TaxID=941449 RepID=UPI000358A6AD|nr:NUDIX domain-containing protein [Desulfovibrio sp. X2]EPR42306.1 NUDIX hydrolase [Desulfovibrio sp. X2]